MINSSRRKVYIASAILILIIASSVAVIWLFLFSRLADLKDDYIANTNQLSETEQKVDLKADLKKELIKISDDLDIINKALLGEENKLDLIQQLEEIAVSTNSIYTIKNVTEVKNPKSDKILKLIFNVGLEGNFQNILKFMRELKRNKFLSNIQSYSISSIEKGIVDATITFEVYMK